MPRKEAPTVEDIIAEQDRAAGGATPKTGTVLDDSYGETERNEQQAAGGNAAAPAADGSVVNAGGTAAAQGTESQAAKGTPAAPTPAPAATATPGEEEESDYQSVRDYAKGLGFDVKNFADDNALLSHLFTQAQRAPQLDQLAQYGQVYVQHADQFQQFLRAQQEAKAAAEAKPKPKAPWEGPEYDPRWETLIEATPAGGFQVKAGHDPAILPKYLAFQEHRRNFAAKLVANPGEVLGDWVDEKAAAKADAAVAKALQQYQDAEYQRTFIERNAWIHAKGPDGKVVMDPASGKPFLSPEGEIFARAWDEGERHGIKTRQAQEQYARTVTLNHLLTQQAAKGTPAAPPADKARQAVIDANRNPNRGGSTLAADGHAAPPQNDNLSLREMLLADFKAAGRNAGDSIDD